MGIATTITAALSLANTVYGYYQSKRAKDAVPSAREIEAKAAREAEKRRVAAASQLDTKGETMFTSPLGIGGGATQLKTKMGQ